MYISDNQTDKIKIKINQIYDLYLQVKVLNLLQNLEYGYSCNNAPTRAVG